jgi:deazaflavin-dependent oxidoreductase (nitroreductase family)
MSDQIFSLSMPRGFLAWLLRAPIWLYRFHLGGLLGNHVLLLTHIGRKTGQTHQTVIEVVQHDEASGIYYVASGWGEKSNWYKNLMANPSVTIQVKNKVYKAVAERVTPEMGGEIVIPSVATTGRSRINLRELTSGINAGEITFLDTFTWQAYSLCRAAS